MPCQIDLISLVLFDGGTILIFGLYDCHDNTTDMIKLMTTKNTTKLQLILVHDQKLQLFQLQYLQCRSAKAELRGLGFVVGSGRYLFVTAKVSQWKWHVRFLKLSLNLINVLTPLLAAFD